MRRFFRTNHILKPIVEVRLRQGFGRRQWRAFDCNRLDEGQPLLLGGAHAFRGNHYWQQPGDYFRELYDCGHELAP